MSSARSRSHHGKQAGKGGPSSFHSSYRRAGSHQPTPLVSAGGAFLVTPSSARLASKQNGGGPRPVRPPRPHPIRLIDSSAHRIIRLVPHVG